LAKSKPRRRIGAPGPSQVHKTRRGLDHDAPGIESY